LAHGGRKLEGNLEILGRKFKEIMSMLEGNFIFQSGSTGEKCPDESESEF